MPNDRHLLPPTWKDLRSKHNRLIYTKHRSTMQNFCSLERMRTPVGERSALAEHLIVEEEGGYRLSITYSRSWNNVKVDRYRYNIDTRPDHELHFPGYIEWMEDIVGFVTAAGGVFAQVGWCFEDMGPEYDLVRTKAGNMWVKRGGLLLPAFATDEDNYGAGS